MALVKKARPWEGVAVDLVYRDQDPVTVAVLPRDIPNLGEWLAQNVERPKIGEHAFVYTYDVTIH